MSLFIFIIVYLICSISGLLLLKASVIENSPNSAINYWELVKNFRFLMGLFLYVGSFASWIVLLSKKELSYIYPIVVGLSYILIIFAAFFILKEEISFYKFLGISFICIGIMAIIIGK
jgi:multidrug transporter EmrE-like cation transporter